MDWRVYVKERAIDGRREKASERNEYVTKWQALSSTASEGVRERKLSLGPHHAATH